MKPKDLQYYLGLKYKHKVEPIPEEEGGGIMVWLPDFGSKAAVYGYGDNEEEALEAMNRVKEVRFEEWLESGVEITAPGEGTRPSGRILVRTSKEIHQWLLDKALDEGISLNLLINQYLAAQVYGESPVLAPTIAEENKSRVSSEAPAKNDTSIVKDSTPSHP